MGKLTFRRVVTTLKRSLLVAALPICGGTLFFFGSFLFWPGSSSAAVNTGALMFLTGSCCYFAAPFLDYLELTTNYGNLLEPPPHAAVALASQGSSLHLAEVYEQLYKGMIVRSQRANCCIYMVGGGFFVGGSVLFFPSCARGSISIRKAHRDSHQVQGNMRALLHPEIRSTAPVY